MEKARIGERPTSVVPLRDDEIVARMVAELKAHRAAWESENDASGQAVEARLRRERTMGAILRELSDRGLLDQGGRPSKKTTDDTTSSVRLIDLGIKDYQSSRWQLEAELPDEKFVQWIKDTRSRGDEISSAGLRKCATEYVKLRAGVAPPDQFDSVAEIDDGTGPCATCGGTGRVAF